MSKGRVSSAMFVSIQFPREAFCLGDVPRLRRFVAAAEQYDQHFVPAHEIEPVAGAEVEPELAHSFADQFDVSQMAECQPVDPRADPLARDAVSQTGPPGGEVPSLPDFDHLSCL